MKKLLASIGLAVGMAGTAQAQTLQVCDDTTKKTYSLTTGLDSTNCKKEVVGEPYTHTPTSTVVLGEDSTSSSVTSLPAANSLTAGKVLDSRYGNGGEVGMNFGDKDVAFGGMAQRLEHAKQVLAAATVRINENLAFSAGAGTRSESARVGLSDATLDNVDLSANNMFIRVDAKFLESIGLDRGSIAYIRERVGDAAVKNETTRWTEDSVIDMGTFTRYITEFYEQNRTTRFSGFDTNKLLASAVFFVGKNGEVTLQFGVSERDRQTTGVVGATAKYYTKIAGVPVVAYGGAGKSVTGNQDHQNIGARVALGNHVSVGLQRDRYSGALGNRYNTLATAMVSLQSNTSEFTRADVSTPLDAEEIVADILSAPEYRIGSVADNGKTETTDTVKKSSNRLVRDVPKAVKEEEKAPEKPLPPGTPNVAPVANADTATVVAGNSVTVNALVNDTDANGDALTITSTTNPQHGTVSISGSSIVYTSTAGYVGADTFTYTVSDGKTTATASVSVNVTNTPRQNLSCTAPASQIFDDNGIDGQVINLGRITCQNTYGSALEYTFSVSGGTTGSVDANGNITIISPNFDDGLNHPQSGTATIKRVDDNNTTSVSVSSTIRDNL